MCIQHMQNDQVRLGYSTKYNWHLEQAYSLYFKLHLLMAKKDYGAPKIIDKLTLHASWPKQCNLVEKL